MDTLAHQPGYYLQTLKQELDLLPKEISRKYIHYRWLYLQQLLIYLEKHPNKQLYQKIQACLDYIVTRASKIVPCGACGKFVYGDPNLWCDGCPNSKIVYPWERYHPKSTKATDFPVVNIKEIKLEKRKE